jgi:hypothetical protein
MGLKGDSRTRHSIHTRISKSILEGLMINIGLNPMKSLPVPHGVCVSEATWSSLKSESSVMLDGTKFTCCGDIASRAPGIRRRFDFVQLPQASVWGTACDVTATGEFGAV